MVADDHPVVIEGIRRRLTSVEDITLVARVHSAEDAEKALREKPIDVVVLDVQMPGVNDAEIVTRLCATGTGVCLFTLREPDALIASMIAAGALGFVSKSEPLATLITAVRTIATGEEWLPSSLRERVDLLATPPHCRLSRKEHEVFKHLAMGLAPKEIAFECGIAQSTVYKHLERVRKKLNVDSASDAMAYAKEWNLFRTS